MCIRDSNIGLELGLTAGTLDAICTTNNNDTDRCFTATLKKWLCRPELDPSWSSLARSLRAAPVGLGRLAEQLLKLDPSSWLSSYNFSHIESIITLPFFCAILELPIVLVQESFINYLLTTGCQAILRHVWRLQLIYIWWFLCHYFLYSTNSPWWCFHAHWQTFFITFSSQYYGLTTDSQSTPICVLLWFGGLKLPPCKNRWAFKFAGYIYGPRLQLGTNQAGYLYVVNNLVIVREPLFWLVHFLYCHNLIRVLWGLLLHC